jgi:SRSO17 transposase
MIDRELYLPQSWTDDPPRCRAARVPGQVEFRTKPQLARLMLERALDAGVPASWVTADEVYGGSAALRGWLESRGVWHVLAVKCTELLEFSSPNAGPGGRDQVGGGDVSTTVHSYTWTGCMISAPVGGW